MPRIFTFLFLLTVGAILGRAQTVRWDPPAGQLGFNQVSQISLVFENCEPDGSAQLPQVEGLVFGRPSQSSQTSIVNFSMTRTYSLVFPVRPTKRSAISIPAFEIKTDKGAVRVAAASYTVGDATVGNSGVTIDDVASATLKTTKDTFWAGEVFSVSYNLNVVRRYFHSLATNVEWNATPLVVEDWSKPDPGETLMNGERRVVSEQSSRAYLKQPGSYTVPSASQMVNLMVGTTGFGLFSQPTVEQRQIESKPLALTIKPLPPATGEFSGAVGVFTFTSKVVPITAAVGEPITWTIELSGTGNWPDITGLPARDVSNDFQVVQPKSKRAMKDGALFEGTLTEDVVLVPTKAGSYQLAPVRFTYFDTATGTYKTVRSEATTVIVTAAAAQVATAPNSGAPVQFSVDPTQSSAPPERAVPTAVAPVAPDNLPRDPLLTAESGRAPFKVGSLWLVVTLPALGLVLIVWLTLAALRSREKDPLLPRRLARSRLAAIIAELRALPATAAAGAADPALTRLLNSWQHQVAALWEVPHAAPVAPLLYSHVVAHDQNAAPEWTALWNESDRALHGRDGALPAEWFNRADRAAQDTRIPGWSPFSLFAPRHLLPFLFTLLVVLLPLSAHAETAADAYKRGDFSTAESGWRKNLETSPTEWTTRHNLGLALGQQDRWAEATAQWTSAFLLDSRAESTRWNLALGLQRSGMAPPELVELSRGEGGFKIVRWATPGEWQLVLIGAGFLFAAALIALLFYSYRRIGAWAAPSALITIVVAVLLAAAATFSLRAYGPLAHPNVALVWQSSTLRSIPSEADTSQKTSPLSAGSIAIVEKTFLGWTKLNFPGGQTGWARTEDLTRLYH